MPPLYKNYGSHNSNEQHSTHKNFDPLPWELYFDELFFLSDVLPIAYSGNFSFQGRLGRRSLLLYSWGRPLCTKFCNSGQISQELRHFGGFRLERARLFQKKPKQLGLLHRDTQLRNH